MARTADWLQGGPAPQQSTLLLLLAGCPQSHAPWRYVRALWRCAAQALSNRELRTHAAEHATSSRGILFGLPTSFEKSDQRLQKEDQVVVISRKAIYGRGPNASRLKCVFWFCRVGDQLCQQAGARSELPKVFARQIVSAKLMGM